MSQEELYRQASVRADERKAAFLSAAQVAKARVAPARLKQDVRAKVSGTVQNGAASAVAKVQERPFAAAAAGGALGIYLFRRPLWALLHRLYVRARNSTPETSEKDDG
ncbi:hypothetical protein [Sphingobium bisphenolivorans]|uniref:hypothetical protein n=1 Tax=Sphingobium bisphenolivorans TaxID=1335760 RepID=UPI00039CAE26|nr:hypothetical protein [Sphingobium bisphenolivorans]